MAAAIDATVSGPDANCYVASVVVATAYFDERLNTEAWAVDEDSRTRALIQATRWLDSVEFEGAKAVQGQALKWPRIGATDTDGYEYDTASIPTLIQHATCELALTLLRAGTQDALANTGLEQFDSVAVGPVKVDIRHAQKAASLPEYVKDMLAHVMASSGMVGRTELA